MKHLLAAYFWTGAVLSSFAQITITQPNPVLVYDTKYLTPDQPFLRRPDSTIDNFHRYNTTEKQAVPYHNLGNFGTAYYPLMFVHDNPIGYKHGFNSFDLFFTPPRKVKFFNTRTPYTFLDFVFGGREEIIGGAEFAANIRPNASFGFYYHRNNFFGINQRQKTIHNNFSFNQWYSTKNGRYDLKAVFVYNGIKNEENGGWAEDNIFDIDIYRRNKKFAPVNLTDALNKWNQRDLLLIQEFRLGPKQEVQVNDTTTRKVVQPRYVIEHQLEFDHWKMLYKDFDTDSSFYESLFYDTDSTTDLTKTWTLRNGLYFKRAVSDSSPGKFLFAAGLQYDLIRYQHRFTDQWIHDIQLKASIYNRQDSARFHYAIDAAVDVAPDYIGDFQTRFLGQLKLKKGIQLALLGDVSLSSPSQKQQFYFGNHYTYQNDFKKIFQAKVEARMEWAKQRLLVSVQNYFIQRYIYFDTSSLPRQLNSPLNVLVAMVRKDFDTKHIYTGTELYAQWVSDRSVVRLPVFAMKQTFCYKGGWLSGKLNARIGFDIMYNTNFTGNAYNPSLAVFYLQDAQRLKFYPILDLFFTMHVKRTNIFLRVEHVNQGMFKQKGIYTAPDYGYLDRTFRVGLTWQFYD